MSLTLKTVVGEELLSVHSTVAHSSVFVLEVSQHSFLMSSSR